jgi:hypothetical protein
MKSPSGRRSHAAHLTIWSTSGGPCCARALLVWSICVVSSHGGVRHWTVFTFTRTVPPVMAYYYSIFTTFRRLLSRKSRKCWNGRPRSSLDKGSANLPHVEVLSARKDARPRMRCVLLRAPTSFESKRGSQYLCVAQTP